MLTSKVNLSRSTGRSSKLLLLLLFSMSVMCMETGCGETKFTGVAPPSSLEPPVPADVQTQVKDTVGQFVSHLQPGQTTQALRYISKSFPYQSADSINKWTNAGAFKSFSGASPLQYDSMQSKAHGNKVIAHAHYQAADGASYRTNFTLSKTNGTWLIDSVLIPSKPSGGKKSAGTMSSAPGH